MMPLLVQVEHGARREVEWRRRGNRHKVSGFVAEFVSNLRLPTGMGVGRHTREGYGEMELIGETGRL